MNPSVPDILVYNIGYIGEFIGILVSQILTNWRIPSKKLQQLDIYGQSWFLM